MSSAFGCGYLRPNSDQHLADFEVIVDGSRLQCRHTIVDSSLCIHIGAVIDQDDYDVKMPCHSLLAKMSQVSPGPVLAELDRLVEPLTKTLVAPVKSSAVKQEVSQSLGFSSSMPVDLAGPHLTMVPRFAEALLAVLLWRVYDFEES